ncbi:MAG: phasin family protein [Alphaproteobacteria bacterium]|nr:phasin family protein [Alphaproteobacteria bacterium]
MAAPSDTTPKTTEPEVKPVAPAKPAATAKVEAEKAPEQPVVKPVTKPVASKAAPAVKKPAVKKVVAKKPVAKKPVAKKPAAKRAAPKKAAAPKVAAKVAAPKVVAKPAAPKADVADQAKEAVNKVQEDLFQGYQDALAFNQGNIDAVSESISIMTNGLKDITEAMFGLARSNFEDSIEASKAMMKCKDIKEVTDLQAELVKTSYEKIVEEAGLVSQKTNKLAGEVAKPLGDRLNVAFESLSKLKKAA